MVGDAKNVWLQTGHRIRSGSKTGRDFRAAANSENSIMNKLHVGKLQSEVKSLQRFVDNIPPELKRQLENTQRQRRGKDGNIR